MKISALVRWTQVLLLPVVIGCGGQPPRSGSAGLAPCPDSPNCVSSQATRPDRRVAPLPFEGDGQAAMQRVRSLIEAMPRSRVVEVGPNLIRAEFHTRIFKFKDDVTFWLDEPNKLIHLRSASRSGYYDFGVNRKRAEAIARLWRKEEAHDQ
jgi:uncharacterized protein (DUF1499 family)